MPSDTQALRPLSQGRVCGRRLSPPGDTTYHPLGGLQQGISRKGTAAAALSIMYTRYRRVIKGGFDPCTFLFVRISTTPATSVLNTNIFCEGLKRATEKSCSYRFGLTYIPLSNGIHSTEHAEHLRCDQQPQSARDGKAREQNTAAEATTVDAFHTVLCS